MADPVAGPPWLDRVAGRRLERRGRIRRLEHPLAKPGQEIPGIRRSASIRWAESTREPSSRGPGLPSDAVDPGSPGAGEFARPNALASPVGTNIPVSPGRT